MLRFQRPSLPSFQRPSLPSTAAIDRYLNLSREKRWFRRPGRRHDPEPSREPPERLAGAIAQEVQLPRKTILRPSGKPRPKSPRQIRSRCLVQIAMVDLHANGRDIGEGGAEERHPLVDATTHSVRREILLCFRDHPGATATDVAKLTGLPKSTVAEQVKTLCSDGLIKQTGQEQTRGTLKKLYSQTDAAVWLQDQDWVKLSPQQKAGFINGLVRSLRTYLGAAMRSAGGDFTAESCWSTTMYTVDEKGWSELAAVHRQAVAETNRIAEESRQRIADGRGAPQGACSSVYLFEMPTWPRKTRS